MYEGRDVLTWIQSVISLHQKEVQNQLNESIAQLKQQQDTISKQIGEKQQHHSMINNMSHPHPITNRGQVNTSAPSPSQPNNAFLKSVDDDDHQYASISSIGQLLSDSINMQNVRAFESNDSKITVTPDMITAARDEELNALNK
jgi:hypothetical protein